MDTPMEIDRSKGQWFVVHTLSGHENKVREKILLQLKNADSVPVYEVYIPTEKLLEVRNGKRITTTRKLFPGYLLIRMDLYDAEGKIDKDTWSFIRTTQGVLGFLGGRMRSEKANVELDHPIPLSDYEAEEMLRYSRTDDEAVRPKIAFEVGEKVRIKETAFENYEGTIEEIDNERGKLKLAVSVFGRSTPIELEFRQVDRITD